MMGEVPQGGVIDNNSNIEDIRNWLKKLQKITQGDKKICDLLYLFVAI